MNECEFKHVPVKDSQSVNRIECLSSMTKSNLRMTDKQEYRRAKRIGEMRSLELFLHLGNKYILTAPPPSTPTQYPTPPLTEPIPNPPILPVGPVGDAPPVAPIPVLNPPAQVPPLPAQPPQPSISQRLGFAFNLPDDVIQAIQNKRAADQLVLDRLRDLGPFPRPRPPDLNELRRQAEMIDDFNMELIRLQQQTQNVSEQQYSAVVVPRVYELLDQFQI